MPPFPKPESSYDYDSSEEIEKLRSWRDTKPGRKIPEKSEGKLLLASWNIANMGDTKQVRRTKDVKIIAEILSWFDLVAIQEVKENLSDFEKVRSYLPTNYDMVLSDQAGNDERMVFVYDSDRVERLELAGEVAIPPSDHRYIKLDFTEQKFRGFDRNPYAVAFSCGNKEFTVVNAHLYFGNDNAHSRNRRALEGYALGRWADLRDKRSDAYSDNVIVIGDLNMPAAVTGDKIYDAFTDRGLHIPKHQTRIGTTITEGKHYDQLAFLPGDAGQLFLKDGVFDFDGCIFSELWDDSATGRKVFEAYVRYYISDHRPIWAQFKTT